MGVEPYLCLATWQCSRLQHTGVELQKRHDAVRWRQMVLHSSWWLARCMVRGFVDPSALCLCTRLRLQMLESRQM